MSRMKRCRTLLGPPVVQSFKPKGIPTTVLTTVLISLDELESIRLADHEDLDHTQAAQRLGVSRSVFTRMVDGARKKVARALVNGWELRIEGGEYHFETKRFRCESCHHLVQISLEESDLQTCPACGSEALINLNLTYGLKGQCRRHGGAPHG